MDGRAPTPGVDARLVRFELATVAVVLLGGYVFRVIWVIPGLAVVLGLALGLGTTGNVFARLFEALAVPRIRTATTTEEAGAVHFSELFGVVVLSVATLCLVVGISGLAWVFALIEAITAALHATTGISLEAAARERLTGRRRH